MYVNPQTQAYTFGFSGWRQNMSIKCKIWWDVNSQSYVVSSSFNEKLVDGLKHVIPASDRDYDRATKFWYLKEPYGEAVRKVAETIFGIGQVSFQSKTVAEQARSQQSYIPPIAGVASQIDVAIVNFVRLLSFNAMKNAYRTAANELHPDKGGSPLKMAELNELWSRIEREVYHR